MSDPRRIPFSKHVRELQWKQGEHIFIAGGTGSGKTTLANRILERRSHVIGFCLKVRDSTIARDYAGWNIVGDLDEVEPYMNRVILWPRKRRANADEFIAHQKKVLTHTFNKLFRADGWCIFMDEINLMTSPVYGQGTVIKQMFNIGRSSGLSLVAGAQRPAYVPLEVLSNASHAYLARTRLAADVKRLSDLSDVDPKATAKTLASLPTKHDFLYLPTQGEGVSGIVNTRQ